LNVLDLQFPKVIKDKVELADDLFENAGGDQNASRLRHCFQAGRNVHSVAEDVVTIDDDIAEIDASALLDAPLLGSVGLSFRDCSLYSHGTVKGIDDAAEFHKQAIPSGLNDASAVLT
jgi:hypothetical protein